MVSKLKLPCCKIAYFFSLSDQYIYVRCVQNYCGITDSHLSSFFLYRTIYRSVVQTYLLKKWTSMCLANSNNSSTIHNISVWTCIFRFLDWIINKNGTTFSQRNRIHVFGQGDYSRFSAHFRCKQQAKQRLHKRFIKFSLFVAALHLHGSFKARSLICFNVIQFSFIQVNSTNGCLQTRRSCLHLECVAPRKSPRYSNLTLIYYVLSFLLFSV